MSDSGGDEAGADDMVEVDPDSSAEGMPRPDLAGITDDTPSEASWWSVDDEPGAVDTEPFALPEIVPATLDQAPEPSTAPTEPSRHVPPRPSVPPRAAASEASWRAYVPAVTSATVSAPAVELRAPGRRPRVRRVTRVVRHVDPWSVFKIGLIFSLVAYVSMLTSGVLLWRVAEATGTIDNVERWFLQFGWETFELKGEEVFHNAWIIGLFGVVALTGALVLLATLFNLVSDIVGGIRVTVLEEEVVERTLNSSRRFVVRRAPAAGDHARPTSGDWSVDDRAGQAPSGRSPGNPPGAWSVDG